MGAWSKERKISSGNLPVSDLIGCPYIVIRKGWYIVLELGKFLHIFQGNKIRSRGEYLAKFDKGRSKLFQSHPDPLRPGQFRNSLRLFSGNLFDADFDLLFYVQGIDQIPKAIFNENVEYFSVSFGVPIRAAHDADFSNADHFSLPSGLSFPLPLVFT